MLEKRVKNLKKVLKSFRKELEKNPRRKDDFIRFLCAGDTRQSCVILLGRGVRLEFDDEAFIIHLVF